MKKDYFISTDEIILDDNEMFVVKGGRQMDATAGTFCGISCDGSDGKGCGIACHGSQEVN